MMNSQRGAGRERCGVDMAYSRAAHGEVRGMREGNEFS